MQYINAIQRWGLKKTYEHFYMFRAIKEGTLVGTDKYGNKYYENLDYPYGQHRWFEPPQYDSPNLIDASQISPEWHGWMHHTTDLVPQSVVPESTGSPLVNSNVKLNNTVDHHYNMEHRKAWRPNPSLVRERGYGVEHRFGKVGENAFYTQPGHPMNANYKPKGPKIEPWSAEPTGSGAQGVPETEKPQWRVYYEKRQAMNKQAAK